ncbi:hypothetical protein [Microscilla marina]|uniref:Uncharacterized protein n=1 Tax=Microscilla marina ATCC 23134 TaxID=313606 RepID=A1ZC03_MICM2|nr:hypothetical protein [Microscilla marina]EAY31805.1 hypothetical protein M23134_01834 [Microscilla marina ATCC 23134]
MNYQHLFSIAVLHNYFSGSSEAVPAINQYLTLSPTPECAQLIKQYRLKLHSAPGKLYLSSPVRDEAQKTFLPPANVTFDFYIKVQHPAFFYFTDTQSLQGTAPRFVVDGANPELSLENDEATAVDLFNIPEQRGSDTSFFLQNKPTASPTFGVIGLDPVPTPAYDADLNKITFDTSPVTYETGQAFQLSYPIAPQWPPNVFGLASITLDGSSLTFDKAYTITFSRKEQQWNYYIVAPNTLLPANLTITADADSESSWAFGSTTEILTGELYDRLKGLYPEAKIFNIASTAALPYQSKAKKGIKLQQDSETIVNNLPNPAPQNEGVGILNIYS